MQRRSPKLLGSPTPLPPCPLAPLLAFLNALHTAVAQVDHPVGDGGRGGIVGDQEYRHTALPVQPAQESQDPRARLGVQVARGFVGQDDGRVVHQCPGDSHALLLSPRKLCRVVIQPVAQAHLFQQSAGLGFSLPARDTSEHEGQGGVLQGGQARQQVEGLEDEADAPTAVVRQFGLPGRPQLDPVHPYLAARGPLQSAHQMEQGRLAGAGDAGHRHELTTAYPQVHTG